MMLLCRTRSIGLVLHVIVGRMNGFEYQSVCACIVQGLNLTEPDLCRGFAVTLPEQGTLHIFEGVSGFAG